MFSRLRRWYQRRQCAKIGVIVTDGNPHGTLTQTELHHIAIHNFCCDCKTGTLLVGPRGGVAVNVLCKQCGSEFNIAICNGVVVHGERNSKPGPRDPGERARLFRETDDEVQRAT